MSHDLSDHPEHAKYIQGLLNKALDEIAEKSSRLIKLNTDLIQMSGLAQLRRAHILKLQEQNKGLKKRLRLANARFNPRLSKSEVTKREQEFANTLPIGFSDVEESYWSTE